MASSLYNFKALLAAAWVALMTLVSGVFVPAATAEALQEYELKAAFLYNYALYVEWPQGLNMKPQNSFEMCVLGEDPFGSSLEKVLGPKHVDGRPIAIRRIPNAGTASSCHLLYISPSEKKNVGAILSAIAGDAVLTVSDIPGFTKRGGMINFVLHEDKIRFFINNQAASDEGLKISSQLLKLALNAAR